MLYTEYIQKAKDLTIEQHDNGVWYLKPEWRYELFVNKMTDFRFKDFRADWFIIEDVLKLEVEKRNSKDSNKKAVVDWLHETITATVDPAMLEEENNQVKAMLELMKNNNELLKEIEDGNAE